MRLTRAGWAALGLTGLVFFGASSTGNNLLYLMLAAAASALFLSWAAGKLNLRGVAARIEPAEAMFRGSPGAAWVEALNAASWTARGLSIVGPDGAAELGDLAPGARARGSLRLLLPHRGRNRVDGLFLESRYPFGLLILRRRLEPFEALALPPANPYAIQAPPEEDRRSAGAPSAGARRGRGRGDFWGPRPYAPDDDARLIHWKLSAKSGRPVVAEYAAAPEGKVLVRLEGVDEASIERAAAACRWHVDAGAETGLIGPQIELEPARGLEQLEKLLRALALAGEGESPRPAGSPPAPRDLGPVDSRGLRRLTLFGAALLYAALFLVEEMDIRLLLLLAPAVPLGALLHERGGPFPPPRLWRAIDLGELAFFVFFDCRISGPAVASTHLLLYLVLNRLLNPWSRGELRQVFLIIFLAFVLVSGLTISPWYLPLFIAWVVFAAAWLMISAGAPADAPRRWRTGLAGLLIAGALIGAFVFMAAPRIEGLRRFNPFVNSGLDKLAAQAGSVMGFTENVSLGHYGRIRRSSARVMRVLPKQAPPESLYIRGAAFDVFDGRAWSSRPLRRVWAKADGSGLLLALEPAAGESAAFEFNVYPMQLAVLFAPGGAWRVEGLDDRLFFDHTGTLRRASNVLAAARYVVRALPPGRLPSDGPSAAERRAREAALQLPAGEDPRVAQLAARWTAGLAGEEEKARAVTLALRRDYSYSTYSDGRRTGLADFLFDVKRGNCEYFATAAAVLLRHAGVPVRLVAGFRADQDAWNEYGRFFDVRQSDAHAWIEAQVPGKGWVVFDPTPLQSDFAVSAEAFMERLSRWADAAQNAWYRRVVGYDQNSQKDAFLRLGLGRGLEGLRRAAPGAGRCGDAPAPGAVFGRGSPALRAAARERRL